MIGNLPLWVVIYIWYLQRKHAPTVNIFNFSQALNQIEDTRKNIPDPVGKVETYLAAEVIKRLNAEKDGLYMLRSVGVKQIGIITMKKQGVFQKWLHLFKLK